MWDAQNGWGLADGNQLVHTIDGGRTWQWVGQRDTALSFYATGPSSGRGEVAGAAWETEDGDLTWQPGVLASAPDGRTWVMQGENYFLDAQVGWQLNSGDLMRTLDGGQTWTNLKI